MADNELKAKIILEAWMDEEQINKEAKKAVDKVTKVFDKDKIKAKLELDKKAREKRLEDARNELKMFKKQWDKDMIVTAKANVEEAKNQVKAFWDAIKQVDKEAENASWDWGGMGKFMKNLKNTAVRTAVISFAKKLADTLIELWTNYQKVTNELDRFTWSAEVTRDLLSELNQFSISNGLDLETVRETASQLLQIWLNAEEVVPMMQQLGDISAWTGAEMEDLVDILKDIQKEWWLSADSFNDLVEAWVPIWDQLAQDLWMTVEEVQNLAKEWKITDEQVSTAFQHMTEEWGAFFGTMESQAGTLQWRRNTLKWSLVTMWESIANAVMPAFEWLMEDAQNTTDALMETGQTWNSAMLMIQKAIYFVVTNIRALIKTIQSMGAVWGSILWWMLAVWQWFITDFGNWVSNLFSADTWGKLWNNLAYGISQGVNGAIDAINTLSRWINKIPWVNFWTMDHVSWGERTDFFDFSNTSNALEGAKNAMKDTLKDIADDWGNFFKEADEWWENLWKETVSTTKQTNATLKDLINDNTKNSSKWAKDSAKAAIEAKKDELKKKRDLMIQETNSSQLSEQDKYQKMLDIANWYKNELTVLEKEETDLMISEAERQLKAKEEQYKKEISYYDNLQKIQDKANDTVKKHADNVAKLWEERDTVKKKAEDALRTTNNNIEELDKDYADKLVERYNKVQEEILKARKKDWADWIMGYADLDMLLKWDSPTINGIDINDAIEMKKLAIEREELEKLLTKEQKEQAEAQSKMTEYQKMQLEYEKERATLLEKSKMLEAISNSSLENAGVRYADESKERLQYFDKEKQDWVDITDFKNSEYARDVLDNQEKLAQKKLDLDTALQDELKAYWDQVLDINKQYVQDTTNYKKQLDEKKKAFQQWVTDMNAIAATLSSKAQHNAYGGNLLSGAVSWVWENWPEQVVARQASYVQPRNAVQSNSTVYNNQSSLSINGLELWNFSSVDEMLAELKNRLTYRN